MSSVRDVTIQLCKGGASETEAWKRGARVFEEAGGCLGEGPAADQGERFGDAGNVAWFGAAVGERIGVGFDEETVGGVGKRDLAEGGVAAKRVPEREVVAVVGVPRCLFSRPGEVVADDRQAVEHASTGA